MSEEIYFSVLRVSFSSFTPFTGKQASVFEVNRNPEASRDHR
jgi:hypothetical protein